MQRKIDFIMLNNLFVSLFAIGLCCADVLALGFCEHKIIFSLLCLYTIVLFYKEKAALIIFILFLLATQAIMMGDSFSWKLLYLLPLSIVALEIKNLLCDTAWLPYLFLIVSILIPNLFNTNLPFTSITGILFIFAQICVNLVVLVLFEKTLSQR